MPTIRFVPADKCIHAVAGAICGAGAMLAGYVAERAAGTSNMLPALLSALAAAVLGIGIELRQRQLNARAAELGEGPSHDIDAMDAVATAAGGLALALAYALGVLG